MLFYYYLVFNRDCLKPEIIQDLLAYDSHVISCGESHVAILTLDWKVFVWGSGEHGRLGTGSNANWYEN